ncbi:cytochrome P450 [Methylovulum psychrotolerans]|uniref:Cytochrome P450 n=1 Tax=Methylovulum psychrotolerans TaxID=1704499 RepID=A0A2S5CSY9_9GAMM|nr:cytochrome P450 [Methylovulum psychrotolerans]POZ53940.1 cytochrome P450 [Methylovulum psychrotolerans]
MSDFIPPYPIRHPKTLGGLDTIKHLRRDLLSFWTENAFTRKFITMKLLNRTLIIANLPEAVNYILIQHYDNYQKKSSLMQKSLMPLIPDSLLISHGDLWQKHSHLIRPFFGPEQLTTFSAVMQQTLHEQQERWGKLPTTNTLPMLPEMRALSATMLCRILFGSQISDADCQALTKSVAAYLHSIEDLDVNTFFGLPTWVPSLGGNKSGKAAKAVHECIDKIIATYSPANTNSLLGLFLSLPDLSPAQIRHELLAFFLAGYDTTATTLTWVWYLLAQCPDVEQRLHQEIDSVLNDTEALADLPTQLPYTRAIIDETLRLYPPFPMLSREAAAPDTFHDKPIPAGATILIVPWLLHRHKAYWEKPDHFIPERFLADAPVKPTPFTYLPFGFGARECVAKQFSTLQLTLSVALLAQHFRPQTKPGLKVTPICKVTLSPDNDVPMTIVKR